MYCEASIAVVRFGLTQRGNVDRSRALGVLFDVELDRLAVAERPEPLALDPTEMDEQLFAVVSLNETVALGVVEPLDGSLSHNFT